MSENQVDSDDCNTFKAHIIETRIFLEVYGYIANKRNVLEISHHIIMLYILLYILLMEVLMRNIVINKNM